MYRIFAVQLGALCSLSSMGVTKARSSQVTTSPEIQALMSGLTRFEPSYSIPELQRIRGWLTGEACGLHASIRTSVGIGGDIRRAVLQSQERTQAVAVPKCVFLTGC